MARARQVSERDDLAPPPEGGFPGDWEKSPDGPALAPAAWELARDGCWVEAPLADLELTPVEGSVELARGDWVAQGQGEFRGLVRALEQD